MARHIRKGDLVMLISGKGSKERRTGKVLRIVTHEDPNQVRVVVEGVNVRRKHVKPTQQNQRGGIVEKELSIHISNVSPVSDGKPTRVRFQTKPNGSKVRVSARSGQQIGQEIRTAR